MRFVGSTSRWPPGPDDEIAALLGSLPLFPPDPTPASDADYSVATAVAEVAEWLEVSPDPQQVKPADRQSLMDDLRKALASRGERVRARTTASADLVSAVESLLDPTSAADSTSEASTRRVLTTLVAQLAHPATAVAAFDDLFTVVQDRSSSSALIRGRFLVLTSTLEVADRSVAEVCRLLGALVDDQAVEINYVLHTLDGAELEDYERPDALAGMDLEARLRLARRYLGQLPDDQRRHVVWVGYDNARVVTTNAWSEQIGPVTFFDGPSMLRGLADPTQVWQPERLPGELTATSEHNIFLREPPWPTEERPWVAARVDLGYGRFSNPVAVGRAQADGLVELAVFRGATRSTWRPLAGFVHVVDGVARSWSDFHRLTSTTDNLAPYDSTADYFADLAAEIGPHLPATDPMLRRLLSLVQTLNSTAASTGPDSIAICVRVVEFVARQCRTGSWTGFLDDRGATLYAYNELLGELFAAVDAVVNRFPFDGSEIGLDRAELRRRLRTSQANDRAMLHLDVALDLAPQLLAVLPVHHALTRRLRDVVRRTSDPAELNGWVDELRQDHRAKVARLSRFRNGLLHSGTGGTALSSTIRGFSYRQAAMIARQALEAVLQGQDVREHFAQVRRRNREWRSQVQRAGTVTEALWSVEPNDSAKG